MKEPNDISERIRGIEAALLSCIGGDLTTRIALSEDDDEIDGIATGINILLDEIGLMLVERAEREAALDTAKDALQRDLNTAIVELAVNPAIHSGRPDAGLQTITRAAVEHLAVGACEIWLFVEGQLAMTRRAAFAANRDLPPLGLRVEAVDYPGYFALLRNSRIIDVSSVGDDEGLTPYWGTQLIPTEVGAFLDGPVRRRGGVVGVLRIQHFDGDREWRPAEMSFVGSLADLVTQTLEIAELVERERELAEAQEIAHLGSWSWDLGARVHWSDETFRILGHAPGSVEPSIQRYLDQVAPPERAALASRIDDCSETGRPFSMNHRIIRPSGEERFVNCYGTLVRDAHAKRIRLGGTCLDITELALAKKAATASKAAEDANLALIRSRSALRETLSNLAHDIRTPLASLKLALGRLLQPEGDFEEVASALRSEVEYLDGLITNLVSLVQIEGDTVQLSYRPSDLAVLLERVQLRFQWLAADEGAVVEVALPGEPVIVSLDPLAMEQAVGNLVHNAVKYAEKHVALLLYVERGEAVIIVHDDGPAPPPETADEPSRQFNRGGEASGGRPGLSLGLNITDELVRRHGGLLTIGAHPVSGSRAEIRLPLDG